MIPRTREELIAELAKVRRIQAKRNHLRFMEHCWQNPSEKMVVGLHTREICHILDDAFRKLKEGESSFYVIKVPFRHGKSEIISRFLPPHFLGEFPDSNVILATYNSSLSEDFSKAARSLFRCEEYQSLYPGIRIAKGNAGVQQWGVENHLGKFYASGLSSGLTGKGYTLGILDDYCASRADAESDVIRSSTWEHFTNDFLTRRSPVSITIVLATPWHVDDIIGRIEKKVDPKSDRYDPKFPKFKIVSFPAMNGTVEVWDKETKAYKTVEYEYLFPERFSKDWYEQQFASLGDYSSASLLQCSPQLRGGNYLKTDKIVFHDSLVEFPHIKFSRVWDLAHTAKQKMKDDPDWTSGTLLAYRKNTSGQWELWVKDVKRFREDTTERDRLIRAITDKDGVAVQIAVENSLDSKDSIKVLQSILAGKRIVRALNLRGDKVARISPVEPILEAGNVHVLRGEWNFDWLSELKEFPNGKHDDQVDNISAGYDLYCNHSAKAVQSHFGI